MALEKLLATRTSRREVIKGLSALLLGGSGFFKTYAAAGKNAVSTELGWPLPLGAAGFDKKRGFSILAVSLIGESIIYKREGARFTPLVQPLYRSGVVFFPSPLRTFSLEQVETLMGSEYTPRYELHQWAEDSLEIRAVFTSEKPFWDTWMRVDRLHLRVNDAPVEVNFYILGQPVHRFPDFFPYPVVHYARANDMVTFTAYYHQLFAYAVFSRIGWRRDDLLPPRARGLEGRVEKNTLFNAHFNKPCREERVTRCDDPLQEYSLIGRLTIPLPDESFTLTLPLVEALTESVREEGHLLTAPEWVIHPSHLERQAQGFLPLVVKEQMLRPLEGFEDLFFKVTRLEEKVTLR